MPRGGSRGGGRPSKGLEQYQKDILHQIYTQQWKHHEVITWLADNMDLIITPRTLQRYLRKWGAPQQDRTEDTEELRQRMRVLLFRAKPSDKEILRQLQIDGFTVSLRGFVRIRKELGYKYLEPSKHTRAGTQ